jgi:hypothetical protein
VKFSRLRSQIPASLEAGPQVAEDPRGDVLQRPGSALVGMSKGPEKRLAANIVKPVQRSGGPVVGQVQPANREYMDALCLCPHFSGHGWLETVQEVLQADWHDAWQDSQAGLSFFQLGTITGIMCFLAPSPALRFELMATSPPDERAASAATPVMIIRIASRISTP